MTEQRHEITVLFGPCTDAEAEALLEKVAGFVYDDLRGENLGAVCALHLWDEAAGAANSQAKAGA